MRKLIIETTVDDIKRVAEIYLTTDSSRAVVTHNRSTLDGAFTVNQI
jgi:hypothetical protein